MAGLFEKDLCLMLRNKTSVLIVVFMTFVMGFSGDSVVLIPYIAVFGTIFTISTINYDEIDNGYTYIMTLPVSYKDYVYEKYIFCTAGGMSAGLLAVVLSAISSILRGTAISGDMPEAVSTAVMLIVLMESVLIPVQLKFGSEKSRIFLVILIGAVLGGAFVIDRFVMDIEQSGVEILKLIEDIPPVAGICGVCVFAIIIFAVSVLCSMGIMRKKQY